MYTRHEMLELVVVDGRARGIIARDLVTGEIETHLADAVVLATGGYGNVFFLSTNAMGCNVTATWRAHRKGAYFGNPCYTQIHPTCIPVSRRAPAQAHPDVASRCATTAGSGCRRTRDDCDKDPRQIPEADRDYYLERIYPSVRQPRAARHRLARRPRTCATRVAASGRSSATSAAASTSTSPTRSTAWARRPSRRKYGNLFDMYAQITGENPYETPMRIYPAVHYIMGGLWVDYDLQSTIPGLFVTGEANFSDHGANRLGASALMQGLADGYFVLPNTIRDYLARGRSSRRSADDPAVVEAPHVGRGRGSPSCSPSTARAASTPSTRSSATSCGSTAAWSARRRA